MSKAEELARKLYVQHPTHCGTRAMTWGEAPREARLEWLSKSAVMLPLMDKVDLLEQELAECKAAYESQFKELPTEWETDMLTDEQIEMVWYRHATVVPAGHRRVAFARAIESAATAPLLEQIAQLEAQLLESKKDAERLDYVQRQGATVELIPSTPDFYPMHFRIGGIFCLSNESIRAAIDAAIAKDYQHD